MISVKNVSKTYNNKKVLDKIDLEIKQGDPNCLQEKIQLILVSFPV